MIRYNIEHFVERSLFGWAYDDAPGAGPVRVVVGLRDGTRTVTADAYQEHLRTAGIADGRAGFALDLARGEAFDPEASLVLESSLHRTAVELSPDLRAALRRTTAEASFLNAPSRLIRCALVLIVRDEAHYVREWVEYHRAIGVDHFVVFDNGSSDGLAGVLAPYLRTGLATLVPWPDLAAGEQERGKGWLEQDTAYACALRLLAGKADWVGCIDVDEFIALDAPGAADLPSFLDGTGQPMVSLFWRVFGTSGIERRGPGLVIERFVHRAADAGAQHTKVFARPEQVHGVLNAHSFVVGPDRMVAHTTAGQTAYGSEALRASYAGACIHHYHTRSREEYMAKVRRGWPSNDAAKNFDWQGFLKLHDRNEVRDDSLAGYADDVRERLAATERSEAPDAMGTADVPSARPNWLLSLSPGLLFHARAVASADRCTVTGYACDLLDPGRKFEISFHDGYGTVEARVRCDQPDLTLRMNRIADGRYGFAVELGAQEVVHLCCDGFAAVLAVEPAAAAR